MQIDESAGRKNLKPEDDRAKLSSYDLGTRRVGYPEVDARWLVTAALPSPMLVTNAE
jgi:hypothetical protein